MKDKDKLILVFYVGLKSDTNQDKNTPLANTSNYVSQAFDDSVKCIVVPDSDLTYQTIRVKQLNTEKVSVKELNKILEKARDFALQLTFSNCDEIHWN